MSTEPHGPQDLLRGLTYAEMRDVLAHVAEFWPQLLEDALKDAALLDLGAARRARPVAPPAADKHGRFDAGSAAEVAAGVARYPGYYNPLLLPPVTAPCLVPAAHGTYPKGSAECDVPGHHTGGAA